MLVAVTPAPALMVSPDSKSVPVNVTLKVLPRAPESGLIAVIVGICVAVGA
jgi:hypothetical protein